MASVDQADPVVEGVKSRGSTWVGTTLAFVNILALGSVLWSIMYFGSIQNALSYAAGRQLSVDSAVKSFGITGPGRKVKVSFLLTNHGGKPVRIVGSRSGCACTVPDKIPFSIGPGHTEPLHVTVKTPDHPEGLRLALGLYTNIPSQPELELTIIGEVGDQDDR